MMARSTMRGRMSARVAAIAVRTWRHVVLITLLLTCTMPHAFSASHSAFDMARKMARGINVLGYDGIWDGGVDDPFELRYFEMIRDAGFRHVRINLFGFKHMDAQHRLSATVLNSLDVVVKRGLAAGLVVVVDEHDTDTCQRAPADCAVKLKAFWRQVSARYAGRHPNLVFEILNEPGGAMTQATWNGLASEVLATIRGSNPTRTVIVGAINSEDAASVRALELPAADRNLIVTVHYYKPFLFTHQGAPWSAKLAALHDTEWGSKEDRQRLADDFAVVDGWAKAQRRPIYLGEFGVYEGAPIPARTRWIAAVARSAERLGWAWAYWQFDHDFAVFDSASHTWIAPILRALIPTASATFQR